MHIKFRKIRWKNLLSTGNAWIELTLDDKPNTLIFGKNGSGKSTLLDAVSLALFGKPFRNIRKNQLVNSINKKECLVEIEFDVGSKSYKVVRGISPNVFEVWSGTLMLNQNRDSKDYQAYLEKYILGMNQKTFNQIVIAGAAHYTPFMKLSAADRRAFVEDLLDIQIFSTMSAIAKNKVSENKIEIEKLKFGMDTHTKNRDMIANNIMDLEKDHRDHIKNYEKTNREIQTRMAEVLILIQNHDNKITKLKLDIGDESTINTKLQKMRAMKVKIETNKENFIAKADFLDEHEDCPTCKQNIEEEFKTAEICRIDLKLSEIEKGLSEISDEIKNLEEQSAEFAEKRKMMNDHLLEREKLLNENKNSQWRLDSNNKELMKMNGSGNVLASMQQNLAVIQQELSDMGDSYKKAVDEKEILVTAVDLLKDGGIKTRIVRQYVPLINQTVNKYLKAMNFLAQFELDETFNETIKSRYRDEFSYENFSEGEKMRIDLALMLTWRSIAKQRNSASANLLILDEVFDGSLDDTGIDDFIKIMSTLDGNVFVISHKQEQMIDKFARVFQAEKKRNHSVMTEIS